MTNVYVAAIEAIGEAMIRNKEYLTDLDAAIGDADHGINMVRGFEAVRGKLGALPPEADLATVLKTVAMTLISTVGGASGPLYGTAFLRAAAVAQGKSAVDGATAVSLFMAAVNGIKERGKATRGEKTMLDALEPAYEAFAAGVGDNKPLPDCLELACAAAERGIEYTKTIVATKGRASYLGERSLGHQDPGATSSYILLKALNDFCRRRPAEEA
ncbi:MAG TPA: dihydroxyacetone kinase subunit DhaL [Selenomonadales bacterium]|nr:dihydroxyacetone kinase subunit DhaL [Selenomonadales bacterium]